MVVPAPKPAPWPSNAPPHPHCLSTLTMPASSESSPKRSARSHSDWVQDSTGMGSLYVKRCCCGSTGGEDSSSHTHKQTQQTKKNQHQQYIQHAKEGVKTAAVASCLALLQHPAPCAVLDAACAYSPSVAGFVIPVWPLLPICLSVPLMCQHTSPHTCVSALAWSISVFASAVSPLMAQPMCSSISATFSMLLGSCGCGRCDGVGVAGSRRV